MVPLTFLFPLEELLENDIDDVDNDRQTKDSKHVVHHTVVEDVYTQE